MNPLLISLFSLLSGMIGALAAPACIVDSEAGRLEETTPIRAQVAVFSGRLFEVQWRIPHEVAEAGKPISLKIQRVTEARGIPLSTQDVVIADKSPAITWRWEIPVTRGPATYEITLGTPKPVVLRVHARDEAMHRATIKALASAKLGASGLTVVEKSAISSWGLKWENQGVSSNEDATLTISLDHDGKTTTRTLIFSNDTTDTLIWTAGPGSGEWRARAPRAWLNSSTMASDEGRIRLLSLLCETPNLH